MTHADLSRRGREGLSFVFEDRQTINILMLELATMIVAIALTFSASYLTVFNPTSIVSFIITTAVVIWFWWWYIMDRLRYPPVSVSFPYLDVLVLISIAIIPFAVRQENQITAVTGVIAFLLLVWALMLSRIIGETGRDMSAADKREVHDDVVQRASVGLLLIADAVVSIYSTFFATLVLAFLIAGLMAVNFETRRKRKGARQEGEARRAARKSEP